MEREREINKLINVLRRTARMAREAAWHEDDRAGAAFSIEQYNRILARLSELDPDVAQVFQPLPADASLAVVAMACRQLAAYYEDESRQASSWGHVYGAAFDTDSFKEFWRQSARDIEDLGEFLRENLEHWASSRKKHGCGPSGSTSESTGEAGKDASKSDTV